jgi:hypothetical protein
MKYMSPKATDPVNIEHITVKQVEKQLDSPSTSTFEIFFKFTNSLKKMFIGFNV